MSARVEAPVGRRLAVGVSIHVRRQGQSLWENGIFQNCIFLVELLLRCERVGEVVLVAGGGDGGADDACRFLADAPVPVVDMQAAAARLDLMIEMSAQLDREWVVRFRERGGKVVSMRVGNDYAIDIERMIFDKPHALLISGAPYDEVWTLPEFELSCAGYFAGALRSRVRIMPHLWGPHLFERARQRALPAETSAAPFEYRPGRRRWRIGIFEPNICMVKTAVIPLLACEAAHRARPRMIEHVWVHNALSLKENVGFVAFASSLDLVRHGLASFEARYALFDVLPSQVDAVVAHQWENAQNYLYYEALHGGFALIHNSDRIAGCGYRYVEFDCEDAARALRLAYAEHDADLDRYRAEARRFLAGLSPEHPDNVRAYRAAIDALFD